MTCIAEDEKNTGSPMCWDLYKALSYLFFPSAWRDQIQCLFSMAKAISVFNLFVVFMNI